MVADRWLSAAVSTMGQTHGDLPWGGVLPIDKLSSTSPGVWYRPILVENNHTHAWHNHTTPHRF
jgi:hypothetical protein